MKFTLLLTILPILAVAESRIQPRTLPTPSISFSSGSSVTIARPAPFSIEQASERRWERITKFSGAFFVIGQGLDYASNPYGGPEANPILATDGHMETKGTIIKAAYIGGWLLARHLIGKQKHIRWRRKAIFAVDVIGGALGAGVASRNWKEKGKL